jgi:hypothetical protein
VERWDKPDVREAQSKQELAESPDDVSSQGQLHVPDMRSGGIHGSPQARQDVGREGTGLQPGRLDNHVSQMPSTNGRQAPVCGKCGKPQVSTSERIGYTIQCVHKALLFEEYETTNLFGEVNKKVKGRMSFFKRLSYQKGNAVAQWEDVIFAVKKGGGQNGNYI